MKAARWPRVHELTGMSRTTVWRLEVEGKFPSRRRLTGHAVGWIEEEVLEWLNNRETGMGPVPGPKDDSEKSEKDCS